MSSSLCVAVFSGQVLRIISIIWRRRGQDAGPPRGLADNRQQARAGGTFFFCGNAGGQNWAVAAMAIFRALAAHEGAATTVSVTPEACVHQVRRDHHDRIRYTIMAVILCGSQGRSILRRTGKGPPFGGAAGSGPWDAMSRRSEDRSARARRRSAVRRQLFMAAARLCQHVQVQAAQLFRFAPVSRAGAQGGGLPRRVLLAAVG